MFKKYLAIALIFFMAPMLMGCPKKIIEDIKQNYVMDLITGNIWVVKAFSEGSADLTTDFAPYEFKFNKDLTVFGQKAGTPDAVGTWLGDATTMTIQAAFPNETTILKKLTGTWKITSNTLSEVKANRFEGATEFKLHLQKK